MSSTKQFEAVIRSWFEVFMSRSTEDFVRFLKQKELNNAQYGTLIRLYHSGQCGVSDIGVQFGMTSAAASQLVDKLVQQGLVERTESALDRRVRQLVLTDAGRVLIRDSFEARLGWALTLGEKLSAERRGAVVQALGDMIAAANLLDQPLHPANTHA